MSIDKAKKTADKTAKVARDNPSNTTAQDNHKKAVDSLTREFNKKNGY